MMNMATKSKPSGNRPNNKLGWKLLGIGIGAALAIAFTADDLTGIGELLDPVEFIAMGLYGWFAPDFFNGMQ
jgi:hypothetical protein